MAHFIIFKKYPLLIALGGHRTDSAYDESLSCILNTEDIIKKIQMEYSLYKSSQTTIEDERDI